MGADIYDWERVRGKGSYQALIDGGCSGGRHQAGCSHGVAPHVWPAAAALEAAWDATKGMRIDAGPPQETAQRAEFLVAALQAAWGAVGERAEKAENKLAAIAEHRNAACAALRITETMARHAGNEVTAERYRAAREALEGGSEDGPAGARRLVAQAEAADTAYRLAAAKVAVYEFLHQYGRSESPAFQVALDLAVSLRKIVDGTEEEGPGDDRHP